MSVSEYDPGAPALFQAEAARLRAGLAGDFGEIEHVGSTAVPGLAGQPMVDLQIEVYWPPVALEASLLELGYRKVGDGIFERSPFMVRLLGSDARHWDEARALRDFLRRHPSEVAALSTTRLAPSYPANRAMVLDEITERAKEWVAARAAVFDAVFEGAGHLQFLGMRETGALAVLRRQVSAPLFEDAQLNALENRDWRPHLVTCVSAIVAPPSPAVVAGLWEAGPRSWVAPQIAATLSLVDARFKEEATQRANAIRSIPPKPPRPPPRNYSPEELEKIAAAFSASQLRGQAKAHSELGPNWGLAPQAKWIASLRGLAPVRDHPDLQRLVEYAEPGDWGLFARQWRDAVQKFCA